jgi:transposase-like protein
MQEKININEIHELADDILCLNKLEELSKKCPRCNSTSANKSNPAGRCSSCLKKLKTAKKTPGHYLRAHKLADDALRRQDGRTKTATKKTKGRGTRKEIVDKMQRAEKKTGQKLSPDRRSNEHGYTSSNVRAVPTKLNRGRHNVDAKKLATWRKRIKKSNITIDDFKKALPDNFIGITDKLWELLTK